MKNTLCKLTAGARVLAFSLLICFGLGGCAHDAEPPKSTSTTTITDSTPTDVEKEILAEMNFARTKPAEYVEQRLQPLVGKSKNKESYEAALAEVIDEMSRMKALAAYTWTDDLHKCAMEWVVISGPSGYVGHDENLGARFNKYHKWISIGENCSYGLSDAKSIVIQLLIDDGVSTRGHRKNILAASFTHAGAAIGNHKKYKTMCCIDFGREK